MVSVVTGKLEVLRALDNLERRAHGAAAKAVSGTTRATQLRIRGQVNAIFSKNRKAGNAIRSATYDNGDRGVAGQIWSRFGRRTGGEYVDFLTPYITGRDILPRRTRFFAVPLQPGKRNRRPDKFDDLSAIRVGGELYLVRSTRTRTLFMFRLIPRVRITKTLDVKQTVTQAKRELLDRAHRAWKENKGGGIDQRTVQR